MWSLFSTLRCADSQGTGVSKSVADKTFSSCGLFGVTGDVEEYAHYPGKIKKQYQI